jgi:phosphoserine phosphatase RsbU/P
MSKLMLLLLLPLPVTALGQGAVTVSPQQCVWRAGDNPAWAATDLDESGWQPYTQWHPHPDQQNFWIRCHANLSALGSDPNPALQVGFYAAYALFVDGEPIGGAGDLRSGRFSMNVIRTFPLASAELDNQPVTIVLRTVYRYSEPPQIVHDTPAEIVAGDRETLNWRRSNLIQEQLSAALGNLVWFGIVGVIGFVLLALFLYDRSRRELLILSIACVSIAGLFITFFFRDTFADASVDVDRSAFFVTAFTVSLTQVWFPFAVARRRMPTLFWILWALRAWQVPASLLGALLSPGLSLRLDGFLGAPWMAHVGKLAEILSYTAPFVAFWPYRRIARRMVPIAVTCMAWGATMIVYFSGPLTPGRFYSVMDPLQAIVTLCATAALLGLLFRDQQLTAQERAELAGEMQAAGEIQRMLAPAQIETAPDLKIDVAFHPMREVGGDFFLCRVLSDGRQRIVVGDVSGKGAAAAMAATLLLGAAAERDSDSPGGLLLHLDRVLRRMQLGGFATCLTADISPGGRVILANAGHLAPYRNGEEVPLESGFPLGIAPDAAYTESTIHLAPNDQLTFLSDGVVEARNATGELFGFDRTRSISTQNAEVIAHAAQTHGQEDDITVLTLTFAAAEVLHA